MPLKIIFAGTPEFSLPTLAGLVKSEHDIVAVFTQPDRPKGRGRKLLPTPVSEYAQQHALPVFTPTTMRDQSVQQQLAELNADVMVVIAYGLILPKAVLMMPRYGCINVHASLLPRWRGAAPIQRAILAGDHETGITIMQMDEGLDSGAMLLKRSIPIAIDDTYLSLHDRLAKMGATLLLMALNQLEENQLQPSPQDESFVTYADKIKKSERWLNFNKPAIECVRKIRALHPHPGTAVVIRDEQIKVIAAEVLSIPAVHQPGTVSHVSRDGVDVATGENVLRITRLQLPGKKPTEFRDFLNANPEYFLAGDRFEV